MGNDDARRLRGDTEAAIQMKLSFEGKWMHLRRMIQDLLDQGWVITRLEPNAAFTLTTVEMENHSRGE